MIPIIRSKDLVHWDFVGTVLAAHPAWKTDGGMWAPDVTFFNGKYYCYYAVSTWGDGNPGIGLATADKAGGPFTDQGKVFLSSEIRRGQLHRSGAGDRARSAFISFSAASAASTACS